MDAHDGFWIFGMGGVFVGSMDFLYRPVSYTPARTKVDGDDVVRLVLAHDDPGVHNWLDTQGFSRRQPDLPQPAEPQPRHVRDATGQAGGACSARCHRTPRWSPPTNASRSCSERYHGVKLRYGI